MEFFSTHVGEQWIPVPAAQKTHPKLGKNIFASDFCLGALNISPGDIDCVRILPTSSSTRPSLVTFGTHIVHGHRRNLMC